MVNLFKIKVELKNIVNLHMPYAFVKDDVSPNFLLSISLGRPFMVSTLNSNPP